jgi:hypothetical protein
LSAVFNQTLEIEDNNSNVVQLNAGADFLTSNRSFQFPNASGTISLEGHAHSSTDISDSTTAGRAILTGADAAAQRTSLELGTLATLNNPMTTSGDLIVGGSSGTPARLGIGTAAQQLRVNSGATGLEYFTSKAVNSDTSGVTGADQITNMMSLTQAEYAAIGSPNASTLYIITDP